MKKRKHKLSEYYLNQSPKFLKKWLEKKRNKSIPQWKKEAIERLIQEKMQDVYLFREQILNQNPLHRLAITRLHNKGLAQKVIINGQEQYNYDARDIVAEMIKIVREADNKKCRVDLENYIKWGL